MGGVTTVMLKENQDILLEETRKMIFEKGLQSLDKDLQAYLRKKYEVKKLVRGDVIAIACISLQYLLEKGDKNEGKT